MHKEAQNTGKQYITESLGLCGDLPRPHAFPHSKTCWNAQLDESCVSFPILPVGGQTVAHRIRKQVSKGGSHFAWFLVVSSVGTVVEVGCEYFTAPSPVNYILCSVTVSQSHAATVLTQPHNVDCRHKPARFHKALVLCLDS